MSKARKTAAERWRSLSDSARQRVIKLLDPFPGVASARFMFPDSVRSSRIAVAVLRDAARGKTK